MVSYFTIQNLTILITFFIVRKFDEIGCLKLVENQNDFIFNIKID